MIDDDDDDDEDDGDGDGDDDDHCGDAVIRVLYFMGNQLTNDQDCSSDAGKNLEIRNGFHQKLDASRVLDSL